jgi:hypothetical protein
MENLHGLTVSYSQKLRIPRGKGTCKNILKKTYENKVTVKLLIMANHHLVVDSTPLNRKNNNKNVERMNPRIFKK